MQPKDSSMLPKESSMLPKESSMLPKAKSMLPSFLNFLNREHYQIYYTPIARLFKSIEAAILLSEFVQRHQYHESRNELRNIPEHGDGWFYHSQSCIEERTGIGDRQFRNGIKILVEHKILQTVGYGMPYKKYYKLDTEGIEILSNKLSTSYTVHEQGKIDKSTENEQLKDFSKKDSTSYTVHEQDRPQCTNTSVHSARTDSLYIEEPYKESQKKRDIRTFAVGEPTAKALLPVFGKYIKITQDDYEALCKKHGPEIVNRKIEDLDDYLPNKPRGKNYKDHVAVLRTWIR